MNAVQKISEKALLEDMCRSYSSVSDPFLHYLPELIVKKQFQGISTLNAIRFMSEVKKVPRSQLVADAVLILNRIIDNETGEPHDVSHDIFRENRSFFWREMGNFTNSAAIILHIVNTVVFQTLLQG